MLPSLLLTLSSIAIVTVVFIVLIHRAVAINVVIVAIIVVAIHRAIIIVVIVAVHRAIAIVVVNVIIRHAVAINVIFVVLGRCLRIGSDDTITTRATQGQRMCVLIFLFLLSAGDVLQHTKFNQVNNVPTSIIVVEVFG